MDCLKRRDKQLEQQFKAIKPIMSTPVHSNTTTSHKISQTPSMITSIPQDTTRQVTYLSSASHPPSVKMDLPTFSNLNSEDPIEFSFEEYIEICEELLAAVSVSLKEPLRAGGEQRNRVLETGIHLKRNSYSRF